MNEWKCVYILLFLHYYNDYYHRGTAMPTGTLKLNFISISIWKEKKISLLIYVIYKSIYITNLTL